MELRRGAKDPTKPSGSGSIIGRSVVTLATGAPGEAHDRARQTSGSSRGGAGATRPTGTLGWRGDRTRCGGDPQQA
jgi:hypothetical protein